MYLFKLLTEYIKLKLKPELDTVVVDTLLTFTVLPKLPVEVEH